MRRVSGEEYRIRRTARAAALLAIVQSERHGGDVVAGLFEKQGTDRRVNTPAHGGHDAPARGIRPLANVVEHLARFAAPVVLKGLV